MIVPSQQCLSRHCPGMTPLLNLPYSQDLAPCDFFLFTRMKSLERKSFYGCGRSFKSDIAKNKEWFWSAWGKNSQHAARSLADDAGRQTNLGRVLQEVDAGTTNARPPEIHSGYFWVPTHTFFYCWNFGSMAQYLAWCKSYPFLCYTYFQVFFLEWWSDCDVAYFDDLICL